MCCFSRPVRHVSGTRIFAREAGERQVLAYSMNYEIDESLAMVLPLPVPPEPGDDAVQFVDLSDYTSFLTDMERAFPPSLLPAKRGGVRLGGPQQRTLPVHDVGAFHASFVPAPAAFARLDPRFRLPPDVFVGLPRYADYGFAVFQLKPRGWWRARRQTAQPMAFTFPRRDPRSLFFPTIHVHDGRLPGHAGFDHALFCQPDDLIAATFGWEASAEPIGSSVAASRAQGLIDPGRPAWRQVLLGEHRNEDVVLTAPAGAKPEDLRLDGRSFRLRLAATAAYPLPRMRGQPEPANQARWRETASRRLGALSAGLREGLRELEERKAAAWDLTTYREDLPPFFLNGEQLCRGTSYRDGVVAEPGARGRLALAVWSDDVEPQRIELAFGAIPDAQTRREVAGELRKLLERTTSWA